MQGCGLAQEVFTDHRATDLANTSISARERFTAEEKFSVHPQQSLAIFSKEGIVPESLTNQTLSTIHF